GIFFNATSSPNKHLRCIPFRPCLACVHPRLNLCHFLPVGSVPTKRSIATNKPAFRPGQQIDMSTVMEGETVGVHPIIAACMSAAPVVTLPERAASPLPGPG
ncbi:unnamed protein product, partial [Ectocarpus sp. 12 AP-2014]